MLVFLPMLDFVASFQASGGSIFRRVNPKFGFIPVLLACLISARCAYAENDRPNVVLVVIDTLRADALSCYGYERQTTPNLDSFAKQNVQFETAISPAGYTPPSMAAIMTGRLPFYEVSTEFDTFASYGLDRFRESPNDIGVPRSLDTLAETLQQNGYSTGAFVTNPYVTEQFQFDQGFDTFVYFDREQPYEPAETIVKYSIAWLESQAQEPFFLYAHLMDVHFPYVSPVSDRFHFDFDRIADATDGALVGAWIQYQDLHGTPHADLTEHARGLYDSALYYVDRQIGVLFGKLHEMGLADNTVIIVTSDHGEEFLDHGATGHEGKLYDEHVRVPLLASFPGIDARRISEPVQNIDILPTILEACDIKNSDTETDAVSLVPLIEGRSESRGRPIFSALLPTGKTKHPHQFATRTKEYKLLHNLEHPDTSELYSLIGDPGERRNVYERNARIVNTLRASMNSVVAKLEQETAAHALEASKRIDDIALGEHQEAIRQALKNMTPEERERAINAALQKLTPERRAAIEKAIRERLSAPQLDDETRERLEALGYVD